MKVTITVECDTISELHSHLHQLQIQIRKVTRKQKLNPMTDAFDRYKRDIEDALYDDNCYGTHTVEIKR